MTRLAPGATSLHTRCDLSPTWVLVLQNQVVALPTRVFVLLARVFLLPPRVFVLQTRAEETANPVAAAQTPNVELRVRVRRAQESEDVMENDRARITESVNRAYEADDQTLDPFLEALQLATLLRDPWRSATRPAKGRGARRERRGP